MSNNRQRIKIEGFVLRKKILLNKDIFITIFTKDAGKIAVIAKGVRKITSKRSAHIQSGNLIKAEVFSKNDINYLSSTEIISGFLNLRSLENNRYIYTILSLLDKLMPEGLSEPYVYIKIKKFFVSLSKQDEDKIEVFRSTLKYILKELGYIDEEKDLASLINIAEENMGSELPFGML